MTSSHSSGGGHLHTRIPMWLRRTYVPLVTVVLVVLVGNVWAGETHVDPNTIAQNRRIRFQEGGDAAAAHLTPAEASLADATLTLDRPVDPQRLQLLVLGNSQVTAIMDYKPGDLTTPQWLSVLFARHRQVGQPGVDVRVGALPNMTPTEYLIRFVYAATRRPSWVNVLLAMPVLEEFRDVGVRPEIAHEAQDPIVRATLKRLVAQNPDLGQVRQVLAPYLNPSRQQIGASSQDQGGETAVARALEQRLQDLADRLPLFNKRTDMLSAIYTDYYKLRNRMFSLSSSSIRPVPAFDYHASLELLELCLRFSASLHIPAFFYLTPLRPIEPNPNLPSDVARFRRDVPALCRRYAIDCVDYSDLVPESMWTNYPDKALGRDFAHFTGVAHRLVADHLWDDLGERMLQLWAQQGSG
jgi:hypothetical protein